MREAGLERAVFGLVNEDRTHVRGRLANGLVGNELAERFQFPLSGSEGLLAGASRKLDLFVDCFKDDRYASSSLIAEWKPRVFALLPIVLEAN